MTQTVKTRKSTEIQSAAICRCTNKETHEVFYMVKSDSSNDWYEVRWSDERLQWLCPCKSVKPCKHQRAVEESVRMHHANEQASRQPAQPVASDTVAILVPEGVAIIDKSELKSTDIIAEPVKANPVQEAQQLINRVVAEKAALHNSNESHFEERSGRLIPMR